MPNICRILHFTTIVFLSAFTGIAQEIETPADAVKSAQAAAAAQQSALQREILYPLRQFFNSILQPKPASSGTTAPMIPATTAFQAEPGCTVAPLDPIEETSAAQLEISGANVVDVNDMVSAAAVALGKFQDKVASVGGKMVLKSAYRPAAYQKHLQNVWYKWMSELKDNHDPACQILRSEVEEEFTRHRLIETQHPVAVSDHTRGLAFDATVDLPPKAKMGRRKVTLDGLARLAGLLRPAIMADPVHFKYLGLPNVHLLASRRRHNA
ncbi:MAG: hypothetical protein ABSG03_31470 [Bryobacteraceae bacterium]